ESRAVAVVAFWILVGFLVGTGFRLAVLGRGAAEDLVLYPGQRVLEYGPQVTERVLADGLGVPRGLAQLPGEVDGHPFQVAEHARAEPGGPRPAPAAAPPPAGPLLPVLPVLRRGPVGPFAVPALGLLALVPGVLPLLPGVLPVPLGLLARGVTGLPGRVVGVGVAGGGVPGLVPGPPGALPDLVPGPPGPLPRGLAGLLALFPADVLGRPGELLAQVADGVPDVLGHLAGDVPDRLGELLIELGQDIDARRERHPALLGHPVRLLAVGLVLADDGLSL